MTIDRATTIMGDDDSRTIELSFSSEMPADREWGTEILDHSDEGTKFSRLNRGAALLVEHDRSDVVGVVERAWMDPIEKKGRAKVRFGRSARANEIWADVRDLIRTNVSVHYEVGPTAEKSTANGKTTYRFRDWKALEISLVSVPVDDSVGVGRSKQQTENAMTEPIDLTAKAGTQAAGETATRPTAGETTVEVTGDQIRRAAAAESKRCSDIVTVAAVHGLTMEDAQRAISERTSVADFQANTLKTYLDRGKPTVLNPDVNGASAETRAMNPGADFAPRRVDFRGLGDLLVYSQSYKDAIKTKQHRTVAIDFPGWAPQSRATLTTTGLTGFERPPGIATLGQQAPMVGMLFAQGATSQPTVRYIRETAFTNAAASTAEEGQKQEATFSLAETDAPVRKIAVIGRVTDESFSDFEQLRSYVNMRLSYMVQAREDSELLNGDGTGSRITGILNTAGIQTQAGGGASSIPDAFFKAITKVRAIGFFEPDYVVMNPFDWQNVVLTKDGNGQYLFGGPGSGAYGVGPYSEMGRIWGKPVVTTTFLAQSTGLSGSFQMGAQLFRREGLRLDTSNSDADDFQFNRIAIRAETRLALAVYRPLAFCTVTGIPIGL